MMTKRRQGRPWIFFGLVALGLGVLAVSVVESVTGLRVGGTVYAKEEASPAEGEKDSDTGSSTSQGTTEAEQGASTSAEQQSKQEVPLLEERDWFASKRAREQELADREWALAKEAEHLKALRAVLEEKIEELKALRTEVNELLSRAESLKTKEVKNLVAVYGSMKTDSAAIILETMGDAQPDEAPEETEKRKKMVLQILSGLETALASKILSSFPPEKAAEYTRRLISIPGSD
jgi:flagellar motility protein MotE (MotC chaperone)